MNTILVNLVIWLNCNVFQRNTPAFSEFLFPSLDENKKIQGGSTLKGKNLLLEGQMLNLRVYPYLKRRQHEND